MFVIDFFTFGSNYRAKTWKKTLKLYFSYIYGDLQTLFTHVKNICDRFFTNIIYASEKHKTNCQQVFSSISFESNEFMDLYQIMGRNLLIHDVFISLISLYTAGYTYTVI